MFSVCYGITDDLKDIVNKWNTIEGREATHILEESLEDTTSFLVDEAGDTLDTTTTSETANSRLGDTLDVVTKDLALKRNHVNDEHNIGENSQTYMTLGSSLSESLSTFSTSRHVY